MVLGLQKGSFSLPYVGQLLGLQKGSFSFSLPYVGQILGLQKGSFSLLYVGQLLGFALMAIRSCPRSGAAVTHGRG
jgi:hypothetical protein